MKVVRLDEYYNFGSYLLNKLCIFKDIVLRMRIM
jgi:hypothetical protein